MEENKTKALNEEGEEPNTPATTPVAEEKVTEEVAVPEVETESAEEVETEEVAEPVTEPRKGMSKRVRDLNEAKKKAEEGEKVAEEKIKSLEETVAGLKGSDEPQAGYQPTQTPRPEEPLIKPGEEIDAIELDKRMRAREGQQIRRTDALITLRGKQQDAVNRHNQETNDVVKKFPQLDPASESFDKDLSESVTEAVEALIRANPYTASVKKFVGKLMKPYQQAVTKEVGKVTKDIAKQTSQTALKPTSVRKGEKSAEDKTVAELEKELGIEQH